MKKFKKTISIFIAALVVLAMSAMAIFARDDVLPYGYTSIDEDHYVTSTTKYNSSAPGVVTGVQLFACYSYIPSDYVNVAGGFDYSTECSTEYDFSGIYNSTVGAYSDHHYGEYGEFIGVTWSDCFWN